MSLGFHSTTFPWGTGDSQCEKHATAGLKCIRESPYRSLQHLQEGLCDGAEVLLCRWLLAPLHRKQLRQIVIASPARSTKITPLHIKSCHEITMLPSCALPCWEWDLWPCSCHP